MGKPAGGGWIPDLASLGAGEGLSLHAQLYRRLRAAILGRSLAPGTRLPSTRTLARDLGVSRTTAEEAYAQLDAEGYLVRRVGDGTYVGEIHIDAALAPRAGSRGRARPSGGASRAGGSRQGDVAVACL